MVAITFLNFNSNVVEFAIFGGSITIPPVIFGILTVVLVWVSINVTNCSDGVDGLSGTLTIITLIVCIWWDQIKGEWIRSSPIRFCCLSSVFWLFILV